MISNESVKQYIDLEIAVLKQLDISTIIELMSTLDAARLRNATVYIFGNGGSASTASHFANDFNKGLSEHLDRPFRFVCLNDNIATIMAIANDISYDEIFTFQLRGKLTKEDIVIGISGSGSSRNVIRAIEYAKAEGARTVGLTGFEGGALARTVDLSINIPVMSMQVTEDVHLILDHLMMAVLYKTLCGIDHIKEKSE